MLGALRTLGLNVEEDRANKRATVEGCDGLFPVGKESKDEVQLFLGNAGTAMRPLTAAVTAAGGNSRSVCLFCILNKFCLLFDMNFMCYLMERCDLFL